MRSRVRILVSMASALAVTTLGASGAAADSGGSALISLDGTTYSQTPEGSIFGNGLVLIPGTSAEGTLYVKNDSQRVARLRIAVADASSKSSSLLEALTLAAATPASPAGVPVKLVNGEPCLPLLAGETIEPQTTTRIQITVGMAETVPADDQGLEAATRLLVSLADPAAPQAEADCSSGGSVPIIGAPHAGADAGTWRGSTGSEPPSPTESTSTDASHEGRTPAGSPAADTPPAAGAGSPAQAGAAVPYTWLGIAALLLGVVARVATRRRAGRTAVPSGVGTSR